MPITLKIPYSLLATLFAFTLVGCKQSTPGDLFIDYQDRIARVQDTERQYRTFAYPSLPRKRDLYINVPEVSISLLDSYQLRQCGLFNLIAERNSVLGKVADEFRNYDYQVALIEGLEACLASTSITQLDKSLIEQLNQIKKKKHHQLNMHKWNLLYASQTMQSQLRFKGWLREGISAQVGDVSNAFASFNRALDAPSTDNPVVYTQEVLEKQPILGDLNYSLAKAAFQLSLSTIQLKENDNKITCGKQRDQTKFRHLNNVFEQQYVGRVQPYMAQLDGYYQQLSPNLNVFSQDFQSQSYHFPIQENHEKFRHAILDHVHYWQQLFHRCGRKIG